VEIFDAGAASPSNLYATQGEGLSEQPKPQQPGAWRWGPKPQALEAEQEETADPSGHSRPVLLIPALPQKSHAECVQHQGGLKFELKKP
jgi:hypothetical protein